MLRTAAHVSLLALVVLPLALDPSVARAGTVLVVLDYSTGMSMATALMADGHDVTVSPASFDGRGHPALREDLSAYDAVFWNQDGGYVDDPELFANLTSYVENGGRVFVTGYDSSLYDEQLQAFLGAGDAYDLPGSPGAILDVDCSLTTGVADIRGLTPSGVRDTDELVSLASDTQAICNTAFGSGAQWTLRTLGSGEIAFVSVDNDGVWTTVASDGTGAFNAALRNFASAADAASGEPGAPEIEFSRVSGGMEGEAITIEVTVTDLEGDTATWSWDTDGDGTFGELPGATSYTIAAGTTDGPSTVPLAVQATDGTHTSTRSRTLRIRNADPVITSSPPTVISVGAPLRYRVTTEDPGADFDPPTFTLIRGPDSAGFAADGTLNWIPADSDVTMGDETVAFEISVNDGDMGVVSQAWEMTVSPNHLPSNVMPLYPAGGILITDTTPRLVVSDASDIDVGDTITYFFELDDEETFEEPLVARGEMLPQTPGFTAYQLEEPLPAGTYHWRAWAFDGFAESAERSTATFSVYVAPEEPDAGVPDGSVVSPDAGPPVTRTSDCSCRAGRAGMPAPIALGMSLLVMLAIGRRRG